MASELLEFEDDDDVNESSSVGLKRPASPSTVLSTEKKDPYSASQFKKD